MTRLVVSTRLVVGGLFVATALALTGCSAAPSIVGVWSADDGSGPKIIGDHGSCKGMYYLSPGKALDIGGPMTCALSSGQTGGYYTLVVSQPPNQASYQVAFSGNTMTILNSGQPLVVLTKQ